MSRETSTHRWHMPRWIRHILSETHESGTEDESTVQKPETEKRAEKKPETDEQAVQDAVTHKQPVQVSRAEKDTTQVLRKEKDSAQTPGKFGNLLRTPAKKCGLSDLPLELLQHIFPYLPLPSQVCLALTSKGFYELFKSALGAIELRFPLMPREGQQAYVVTEEYHVRMTLLSQLEDSRWACCGRFQRLHPRQEFPGYQMRGSTSPWNRTCMSNAGILDLCPCIALTLRDRARIVEDLSRRGNEARSLNYIKSGVLSLHKREGEPCLLHRCTEYPQCQVEIRLSLTESEQLISRTQYETRLDPYDNLLRYIRVCCRDSLADFLSNSNPLRDCSFCHARTIDLTNRNSSLRVAQTTQYLGERNGLQIQSHLQMG